MNGSGAYLQYENMQGEKALFTVTAEQESIVSLYISADLKGTCWLVYYNPDEGLLQRHGPLGQAEDIYSYPVQPGDTYFALILAGVTGNLVMLVHELDEGITLRGH